MIPDLRNLRCEERLRRLGLWMLEERRNRSDLLELFKVKSGLSTIPLNTYFELNTDTRTRGHSWKLTKKRCRLDVRKYFFSERVIDRWNSLPQTAIDQKTLNGFKRALERMRKIEVDFFMDH